MGRHHPPHVYAAARSREHYRHLAAMQRQAYLRERCSARRVAVAVAVSRDAERQVWEDRRANHRNLNRMLTLAGALVLSFLITYITLHSGIPVIGWQAGPWLHALEPYSFAITILMDSSLALYSFVRHY